MAAIASKPLRVVTYLVVFVVLCACTTGERGAGTALPLATAPSSGGGCAQAGLGPVRIARADDQMVFPSVATGEPVSIVWPRGFVARLVNGRAEPIASDGMLIGREGDILANLGGSTGVSGGPFFVCSVGTKVY